MEGICAENSLVVSFDSLSPSLLVKHNANSFHHDYPLLLGSIDLSCVVIHGSLPLLIVKVVYAMSQVYELRKGHMSRKQL